MYERQSQVLAVTILANYRKCKHNIKCNNKIQAVSRNVYIYKYVCVCVERER